MSDPTPTPATIGAFTAGVARLSAHGDFSGDGATDVYTVYLDDPDDRLDLTNVTGLPAIGAAHPLDASLVVSDYQVAEHRPGELFREVRVVYARGEEEDEGGTSIGKLTALDYPSYTQSGDLVTDQVGGAPVLNSADDVFDSVPQFETLLTGVHFTRRVASFPSAAIALSGTVNSAAEAVYGITFQPRTARVRVTARYTFDGSSRPWEMDVTVEPRRNLVDSSAQYLPADIITSMGYVNYDIGWDLAILECGFQYIDAQTSQKVRFMVQDENGNESAPSLPQKLTATGGDGRAYGTACFLVVRTAPGASWTALKAKATAPN
jgi:hypothetical protein